MEQEIETSTYKAVKINQSIKDYMWNTTNGINKTQDK